MKGKVCDLFPKLRVGMKVRTNGDGTCLINGVRHSKEVKGEVGSIDAYAIVILNNTHNGDSRGIDLRGYKYGWHIYTDNSVADIEILSTITTTEGNNMNLISTFKQLFLKEPTKSFNKIGILDGDGFLNEEGTKIFVKWLLDNHADKFRSEVVDNIIKEMDANEKK